MVRYCILCGQLMGEDDVCRNPGCRGNQRDEECPKEEKFSGRRPVRLIDRLKNMEAVSRKEPIPEFNEEDWEGEEDWEDEEELLDEEELQEQEPFFSEVESASGSNGLFFTEERPQFATRNYSEIRQHRELLTVMASVLLSAVGTLIFGVLYLEDFFRRWVVAGLVTPVMAYGVSFLYGWLMTAPSRRYWDTGDGKDAVTKLLSAVTSAGRIPNALLLLSCLLSPMDRSMSVFQCFSLLLVVAWVVCLCYRLMALSGRNFSPDTPISPAAGMLSKVAPIVTILFAFLALATMRAVWVWYLTGDFRFALHLPLSAFLR